MAIRGGNRGKQSGEVRAIGHPIFGEKRPTADPTTFLVKHPSDGPFYKKLDELNAEHKLRPVPFPAPRGIPEPRLSLADVLQSPEGISWITGNQQIVFHALGDCGSTRGPQTEDLVTDKLAADFQEVDNREVPQFNLLLGDIVYNFGEVAYYYDQFYDPYRDYPAPILAAAGNHDGLVPPGLREHSLEGYLRNFCQQKFVVMPEAGGLSRTAQIQPGVFFTFEAPFVRIVVLYSNNLEDPGVIADPQIGDSQLTFLEAALTRVKDEKYTGALLFAHHHPPFTLSRHGWSVEMQAQIDAVCERVGVWPHADLSGHAHNYQRFTRYHGQTQIPYVVCGNGGHNVQRLVKRNQPAIRAPQVVQPAGAGVDQIVFESYDDLNYGYLRLTANEQQLRIEYHPASDGPGTKTPDDFVTVDLATRTLQPYAAPNTGYPKVAAQARARRTG